MLIRVIAVCIGLAGAPSLAGAELFTATRMVIAILADELFVGEAIGHLNGAGSLAIRSQKNRTLICLGEFTSSAALGGSGQLHCSDGATATFSFQRLSVFRGYGVGSFGQGTMSFVYGHTVEQSEPYLKLPAGKKLIHNGTELALVDR